MIAMRIMVAVLLSASAALASANTIVINIDETSTDSITVNTGTASCTLTLSGPTPESLIVDCPLNGTFGNFTIEQTLLDLSGIVSDTFLETITPTGTNTAALHFDLESCDGPASCGLVALVTGTPEVAETFEATIIGSGTGADEVDVTVKYAADVPTVPEPATLTLLGLGLAGLGFSRRKRT